MRAGSRTLYAILFTALLLAVLPASARADEDSAITARVKVALIAAQISNAVNIQVRTFNGEVDLAGVVYSERSKEKASAVTGAVTGVKAVRNDLEVQAPTADDDEPIATKVRRALIAAQIENAENIEVKTLNNEVDLAGIVYSDEDKTRAARIAGAVRGVVAVQNNLEVRDR